MAQHSKGLSLLKQEVLETLRCCCNGATMYSPLGTRGLWKANSSISFCEMLTSSRLGRHQCGKAARRSLPTAASHGQEKSLLILPYNHFRRLQQSMVHGKGPGSAAEQDRQVLAASRPTDLTLLLLNFTPSTSARSSLPFLPQPQHTTI